MTFVSLHQPLQKAGCIILIIRPTYNNIIIVILPKHTGNPIHSAVDDDEMEGRAFVCMCVCILSLSTYTMYVCVYMCMYVCVYVCTMRQQDSGYVCIYVQFPPDTHHITSLSLLLESLPCRLALLVWYVCMYVR